MAPRNWLSGLRRAWIASGALSRFIEDRGVTGVVYTPASYEMDDAADSAIRLVDAGAAPDASLLWDIAVTDIRAAADALLGTLSASDWTDGFVAVWLDAARLGDPDRAFAAAGDLAIDVGAKPNVAAAFAWNPSRTPVVERLVAEGMPIALANVRDDASASAVSTARARGMERRRANAEEGKDVAEVPVFLLGGADNDDLYGVTLQTELGLFGVDTATARVPLSPDAEQAGLKAAVERLAQRTKDPARGDRYTPAGFARSVERECNELQTDEVLEDIWSRDHELWKEDPTEISDRLGWLDVAERMHAELDDLKEFARKARTDVAHVVLCGMGGSSLAPETFSTTLGAGLPLTVLDTTHPDHVAGLRESLDIERSLFVIASKSGTTVETRSHLEYFWSLVPRGERFVAITDPATPLAQIARERNFLRVFENQPDIGGRYSALSYFGLVPAALCGVDLDAIVNSARRAMLQNGPSAPGLAAPAVRLGAAISEAASNMGRDKLTLVFPRPLASFGAWIEQLIAESTGKEASGVLPVTAEPLGPPDVYGEDRLFVVYTSGDEPEPPQLEALEADHPVVRIRLADVKRLGGEMFRWEMATAIVGYELDINPFDQPDVEAAKQRAREALDAQSASRPDAGSLKDLLAELSSPRYIALQAFIPPTSENAARLESVRSKLRDRYRVATTVGFGPRFLHSTGQYHKGGPNTGAFIQITDEPAQDIDIPAMGFSFGRLIAAQADGDLQALRDKGREAVRVSLSALEEM